MEETQKKIDSEKQRLAEVSNGGYARKENEWEQAVKDASMAKDTYNEHRNGAAGLHSEAEVAERQDSEAWQPIELKNKEIEQAKSQLENLNRQGGEMRTGRHPKIPTLLREIQKERSFQSPPVGPICDHVTLLKPKWSSVLENVLGGALNGFIVSSKRDSNILLAIMGRLKV
jgi:chromosome segregation ATPase